MLDTVLSKTAFGPFPSSAPGSQGGGFKAKPDTAKDCAEGHPEMHVLGFCMFGSKKAVLPEAIVGCHLSFSVLVDISRAYAKENS